MSAMLHQVREGRMTHALMISGEAGVGKWTLAVGLAAMLLCESADPGSRPCGKCRSCIQMEKLSHPDVIVLEKGAPLVPTDTKTVIPVSDVKEMTRRISLQGYENNGHIVLIHRAEDMNEASQNKLLKTLEEPPEGTFFLLTCRNTDLLLPTIVSRCRPLKLHPWGDRDIIGFLTDRGIEMSKAEPAAWESGGSIGQALKIAEDNEYWQFRDSVIHDFLGCRRRSDILPVSSKWKDQKDRADAVFSVLENCFSRLMHDSLNESTGGDMRGIPEAWRQFGERARPEDYVKILDAVALARKRVHFSVNFQAVTEQLILTLTEAAG